MNKRARRRLCQPRRPRRIRHHQSRDFGARAAQGFFYAPDPSSQIACTLAGNLAMNSGGAHCLKYGVTTNNVLGVKMVLMDGTIVDIGGAHLEAPGYDMLSYVIGSEGQLGVITEATVRILRAAEGARPMLLGFDTPQQAGACVAAIIGAGHCSSRHRVHGQARHSRLRGLCRRRLSAGCRSAAHCRGRGLGYRDRRAPQPRSLKSPMHIRRRRL